MDRGMDAYHLYEGEKGEGGEGGAFLFMESSSDDGLSHGWSASASAMDDSEWGADLSSNDDSDSVSGSYSWDKVGMFGMETDTAGVETASSSSSSSLSTASRSYSVGSEDTAVAAAFPVEPASGSYSIAVKDMPSAAGTGPMMWIPPPSALSYRRESSAERVDLPARQHLAAVETFPPGGHMDAYNLYAGEGGAFMESWEDEVGMFGNKETDTTVVETASSSFVPVSSSLPPASNLHGTDDEGTEQAAAPPVEPASGSYSIAVKDKPSAAGTGPMMRIPPPSALSYRRESSAERVDLPARQHLAAVETTADLVARGCRDKLPIEEFQQLLLDDTYVFQQRPQILESNFGIFRESPKQRRKPGSNDKWINSGGKKGSIRWPTTGPARIMCQYGAVTCLDGRKLRYYEYTFLPDGNPSLSEEKLARHVWQVCALRSSESNRQQPERPGADQRPAAASGAHRVASAANQLHKDSPKQKRQQMPGQPTAKRKRRMMTAKTLAGPVRIRDTRPGSDALGARLLDLAFVGRADDYPDEFEMQDLKYISFQSEGAEGSMDEAGSLSTSGAGLKFTTAAGDFAEWHELSDQAETLKGGDVVGIRRGKVSRRTARAAMVGVVTDKAAVVGSLSRWTGSTKRTGAEIAYCGRVPVRVRGPVQEGEVLVCSGREDGLAVAINNSSAANQGCEINCTTEQRVTRPQLQVGVAMQTCNQAQDRVSLVEIAVTGPSMSSSSLQRLDKTSVAACTIRAVAFATLFIAVLSTAAVWFTIHNIPSDEAAEPGFNYSAFFNNDDEIFPTTSILTQVVCHAGMDRRPESLRHLPCFLFQPRGGVPGTVGVFQPVNTSACGAMLDSKSLVAEACWELQYGDTAAAYSDDPFYEKLHLAKVPLPSSVTQSGIVPITTDRGPFRCEGLNPNIQACPPPSPMPLPSHQNESLVSCADLIYSAGADWSQRVLCSTDQLMDLMFGTDNLTDYATLYELGATVPIDTRAYLRNLCPETCANTLALRRRTARRSLGEKLSIGDNTDDHQLEFNSSIAQDPEFFFANVPQSGSARSAAPATPPVLTLSGPLSTWWLGGVLKTAAPPVPAEFMGDAPWLCLEDAVVSSARNGLLSTFALDASPFMADSCASRSTICDPDAREPISTICQGLYEDDVTDMPLLFGICPDGNWLNTTSGSCHELVGLPPWNATEAQQTLIDLGLKRPWGDQVQVPGGTPSCNDSCRAAGISHLQDAITVRFFGR